MKKIFLSFVFILTMTLSFSNTSTVFEFTDCHSYACEELGGFEQDLGEMGEAEAEGIYQYYYNECTNGGG